jgi:hypothetical protein
MRGTAGIRYTRYVIEDAWPLQRRGVIPKRDTEWLTVFQREFLAFEPRTKSQELMHGEALHEFNHLVEVRRARIQSVNTAIPTIMWYVVAIGALVSIVLVWLLEMHLFSHLLLGGLLAFFNGTLISLIVAMDRPFLGEVSVSADAYQVVYQSLMQPDAEAPSPTGPK